MIHYSNLGLGQAVRGLREGTGMTQEQLGRKAGYQTGAGVSISRLESGLLHPGSERFAGLANALGLTPEALEARAAEQTAENAAAASPPPAGAIGSTGTAPPDGLAISAGSEKPKERARRIQHEVDERTRVLTDLTEAFNLQYDRACDEFSTRFLEIRSRLGGAPPLDPTQRQDDDAAGPDDVVADRRMSSSDRVGQSPPAVRGGSASSAALSAAVVAGIVGAPSLMVAAGGLLWMRRNRKQQQELAAKLDEAEAELASTRPGVEAIENILPRATETLDYIATHAGHALTRWEKQLGPGSHSVTSLSPADQRRYQDFVDIADALVKISTIDVQGLLTTHGHDRDQLIQFAEEVLTESAEVVNALV